MRARGLKAAAVAVALLTMAPGGAPAQDPREPQPPTSPADADLARHLAGTPVTLMDWGMLRLERELDKVVRRLGMEKTKAGPSRVGTMYRFQDRRVLAYISLPVAGAGRTEAYCRELFRVVREEMLAGAPNAADGAEWYLTRLFGSDMRRAPDRPPDYGEKLLDMVHLEVTLRPPPGEAFAAGPGTVACAGRLDAQDAYIVPPPGAPRPQG